MLSRWPRNRDFAVVAIDGDLLRGVQVQRRMSEIRAISARVEEEHIVPAVVPVEPDTSSSLDEELGQPEPE